MYREVYHGKARPSSSRGSAAGAIAIQPPKALVGLKTGGPGQFRTEILRFFGDLIDRADERGHVEVRTSIENERYGVSPATLSNWLAFFARRGWIRRIDRGQRGPGRGRGSRWEVRWVTNAVKARERGERAYRRRLREAEEVRRQFAVDSHLRELEAEDLIRATGKWRCKRGSAKNIKQRTCGTSSKEKSRSDRVGVPPTPAQELLLKVTELQETVDDRLAESDVKPLVLRAFRCFALGRMRGQGGPPRLEEIDHVRRSIAFTDRVPIPRWAKDVGAIFRWVRSLWAKLLEYGATWWRELKFSLIRKLEKIAGDSPAEQAERAWIEGLEEEIAEEEAEERRQESCELRREREFDVNAAWQDWHISGGKGYLVLGADSG